MSDISGKLSENKDLSATISPKGGTLSASLMSGRGVGHGIPAGGTTGQALVKASNDDYDATWKSLDSGDVAYSDSETYGDGTVGKEVAALKSAVSDMYPTDTASGAIASFPDGAKDVPVDSLIVNIEPVQEGSGDPSPDNICPISGHEEVSVVRCGVNLWDEEWEQGTYDTVTGQEKSAPFYFRTKNPIIVKPDTTYHVTIGAPYSTSALYLFYYDQNDEYLGYESRTNLVNYNLKMPSRCHYARFVDIRREKYDPAIAPISINYPSTATAYEPYQGETYTVSLGDTIYGGTLDVTKGELVVTDATKVFDNTGTWAKSSALNTFYQTLTRTTFPYKFSSAVRAKSDRYKFKGATSSDYSTFLSTGEFLFYVSGNDYGTREIAFRNDEISTVDAWRAELQNNPITVCYELATPITISLTPQQITTLYGTNNVFADTGDSTVTYKADVQLYIQKKISAAVAALS